ncbi:hypothetical protein ILUMI_07143 [Ignelater luminosus]|uniref:HTH CENPB-type domain-containing protein n=1 Tax=Ignelater luminosus TaxID=2038154 RepID=A0A8K0D8V9_IGNLU|nr:hypothetical protein ILUMI_07143 [Ignelater luminosus]
MSPNKLYQSTKYSPEDMGRAIAAVKGEKSVAFASKQFNAPQVTLFYKIQGKYEVNCRIRPPTILTQTDEQHLVHWLLNISDAGFPATTTQLFDSVQILVKKLNKPNVFKNSRPSQKWFNSFIKRNPQISEKLTQNLTQARFQPTEEKIRSWLHEIRSYIDSKDLSNIFYDPRRIYDADETAFS